MKASDDLGNFWEVYGWTLMTSELDKSNVALQQQATQIESILKNLEHKRTLGPYNPASKVDLSKLPLPQWKAGSAVASKPPVAAPVPISFENQAPPPGLAFEYVDGSDPRIHGLNKMFQINGGGVGVFDYDRDGWPDLYFTQVPRIRRIAIRPSILTGCPESRRRPLR